MARRELKDFPAPTPVLNRAGDPTPCVLWQGRMDKEGYGVVTARKTSLRASTHGGPHVPMAGEYRAHRWVWEQRFGKIPPGKVVRHKCDNRICVRISHLELGTVADNNRDTVLRGHAGRAMTISPSQHRRLLEMRDDGMAVTRIIKELRLPIKKSQAYRLVERGWAHYNKLIGEVDE